MSLSKNIKYLREAAGHTQEELAQYLSVSRTAVSSYERGKRLPDGNMISQISRLYGVSLDSLMHDDYELTGFMPPLHRFPPNTASQKDSVGEDANFGVTSVLKPTKSQMRKKIVEVYERLGHDDQLLLLQIAIRLLLSQGGYGKQPQAETQAENEKDER